MARQNWVNLLNYGKPWQTNQGTQLATSATTATISPQAPGPQDFVMPGQDNGLQWYEGMSIRVKATGTYGSAGTTSNLTIFLAMGVSGTLANTMLSSGAQTLGAGSVSNLHWWWESQTDVVTLLTSAATCFATTGTLRMQTGALPATLVGGTSQVCEIPMAITNVNGSVLSPYTAATAIGLRATLSAAFGNVQCDRFTVEQIG